jgi:hypothetical protein
LLVVGGVLAAFAGFGAWLSVRLRRKKDKYWPGPREAGDWPKRTKDSLSD